MSSGGLILNGLPRTRPSWWRNRASPGGQRNGAFAFCGSPARFACLILWPALSVVPLVPETSRADARVWARRSPIACDARKAA